jgi:molecular chaperone DnaK (HSP70)
MADDQHFFVGIDLGTTNCSIHWGALNPQTNRVEPRALSFDQRTSEGTIGRRVLLPSYIWFRQEESAPTVGEFARTRGLEAQPSRVARAVKSFMGRADWHFDVDGRSYSAAQLSGIILQTLAAGIRRTWQKAVDDVVITVPASFDGDMRADTLLAAELANFKTKERDNGPRNLLLDEPRAALYDFLNQQLAGHLPPNILLDLGSPKIVLVFDLGGGTLDVSLHRVKQSSDVDEIGVEDLAISRYAQLGGGVFDGLVADELQKRFEARNRISLADMPPVDRQQVRVKFEIEAERVKQRLTDDIETRLQQGAERVPDDFSVDIQLPYVYDNKGLITRLSKREFEEIISPLLAPSLTLLDVDRFDQFQHTDSVVYPILDVLHKAKQKLGYVPCVEAILLNGGMTRVHAIRDRLVSLFGINPITVLDPEQAVSRGAAIYHYLLHRGWRPRQILAETIGVEVEGGRVFQLVPAGTVLPFHQDFVRRFQVMQEGATRLDIPLYRGEALVPGSPNKKILERRFTFSRPQALGTAIHVVVEIDENKVVHFSASLPDGESAEVAVRAEQTDERAASNSPPTPPKGQTVPPPPPPQLDPEAFRRRLRELSNNWDEPGLKELGRQALVAGNSALLMEILIEELPLAARPGKQRIVWVLGEYGMRHPDDPLLPRLIEACIRSMRQSLGSEKALATVARMAVVALGKIGSQTTESHLVNVLDGDRAAPIRSDILIALGKCGATHNAVQHVMAYVGSVRDGERIGALWALGRLGSREREPRIAAGAMQDLLPEIGLHAFSKHEQHEIARKHAVYALGEIGDRRPVLGHQDVVDSAHAAYVEQALVQVQKQLKAAGAQSPGSEAYLTYKLVQIALKQVRGESLTEDESRVLMGVRVLMGTSEE